MSVTSREVIDITPSYCPRLDPEDSTGAKSITNPDTHSILTSTQEPPMSPTPLDTVRRHEPSVATGSGNGGSDTLSATERPRTAIAPRSMTGARPRPLDPAVATQSRPQPGAPTSVGPQGVSTARTPALQQADILGAVGRAQAGDLEAFAVLYDRYADVIFRYVRNRVGSVNIAEDLTSETFVRALRRITSFTWQGKDFAAWLVTIARNLVADHFKSGRFRLEVSTAEMLDADHIQDSPEQAMLDSYTQAALLEAIHKLDTEQRTCVILRFLSGLSVAETAAAMDKNPGAIKALQYRAVRSLARLLPQGIR